MSLNDAVEIGLGFLALGCYATLFLMRVRHDRYGTRLLFVDLLLLLGAVEIVADDLHLMPASLLTRGAYLAGGVALVLTFRRRRP